MDEPAKDLARRAARRLAADFGPALPALVERELRTPNAGPQRYLGVETAIAIAVSSSTLLSSSGRFTAT